MMRMLWARSTKIVHAVETALRQPQRQPPSTLVHWATRPAATPTLAEAATMVERVIAQTQSISVSTPTVKGHPDMPAIKRSIAREVAEALGETRHDDALRAAHRLAAVDLTDGTTYLLYLTLMAVLSQGALSAARASLKDRIVLHLTCLARLDRAQASAASFAAAETHGIGQLFVVGSRDTARYHFDPESRVLTVPAADTYEHLPAKVVGAMAFLALCGTVEGVLKVDDDHRLRSTTELIRGFGLLRRARPIQIGKMTDVGVMGMHPRAWHFGKCADPVVNREVFTLPGTTRWANGSYGYFLNRSALDLLLWSHVYFDGFVATGLYEDLVVSELLQLQGGSIGRLEMLRLLSDVSAY